MEECHLSLSLDSLYAFHCEMFGASAGNADSNSMPNDGMKGEALIILQVMTGEVVMLCLFFLVYVHKQEDGRWEEVHKQMPEDLSQVPKRRQAHLQALCCFS
jgi:hypothetical protein